MTERPSLRRLDPATRRVIEREYESLRSEYRGVLEPEVVEECLQRSLEWLTAEPRISTFVPVLARRRARQELRSIVEG